jgi:hypothetical protein
MRTGKNIIGFPEPRGNNKKNLLGREIRNRPLQSHGKYISAPGTALPGLRGG